MSVPAILSKLRIPVIASPLFIISSKELVLEQCKAGIVGSFPALNARGEGEFEKWLQFLTTELDKFNQENPDSPAAPFAVNQIVNRTNSRLHEDMELCVKYKAPIIITSLGAREEINEAAHSYGGIVLHDIINQTFARKAIAKGADGLIAVATGAGGHAGNQSPFALISEIRQWFDGPLALSGCISTGEGVLAAQAMGADFGYIGSAFIATHEANAADGYKNMIVDCDADDIINTNRFTGVHGNYLIPSIEAAGIDTTNLDVKDAEIVDFGEASKPNAAKAWKDIWGCGQGIGAVREIQSAAEKVAQLEKEYHAAKQRIAC